MGSQRVGHDWVTSLSFYLPLVSEICLASQHKAQWSPVLIRAVHKGRLHVSFNVPLLFVAKHCFLESGLILKQKYLRIYRYICDLLHLLLTHIVYDTLSLINHILRLSQTCVSKVLSLPSSSILPSSQTLLFLWGLTYIRNTDMCSTTTSHKDCFILFISIFLLWYSLYCGDLELNMPHLRDLLVL